MQVTGFVQELLASHAQRPSVQPVRKQHIKQRQESKRAEQVDCSCRHQRFGLGALTQRGDQDDRQGERSQCHEGHGKQHTTALKQRRTAAPWHAQTHSVLHGPAEQCHDKWRDEQRNRQGYRADEQSLCLLASVHSEGDISFWQREIARDGVQPVGPIVGAEVERNAQPKQCSERDRDGTHRHLTARSGQSQGARAGWEETHCALFG